MTDIRSCGYHVGLFLFMSAACIGASGCGGEGPAMGRVTGKVTRQGKPLTEGTIAFVATEGQRPTATSAIAADGTYDLQTTTPGDGARVGDYRVAVSLAVGEPMLDYIPKKKPGKRAPSRPSRFENPDTSGMRASVKPGRNRFDFDLEQ